MKKIKTSSAVNVKKIKSFSCERAYGKIRETNLPREKSDILTEMKRRHNKYGRTEL